MKGNSTLIIVLLAVTVAIFAYVAYERRSPVEKAADALREAGREIKDAVDPRTPAEKVRDGIKDTVRDIKK